MNFITRIFLPFIIVLVFLASQSIFIINQWETALRLQFGRIVEMHTEPGLYFKIPFIQNVHKFDNRIQTLETTPGRFLTQEQKNLFVDVFVKWKIVDSKLFYQRVQGSPVAYNRLLEPVVMDKFRSEFGRRDLQDVVAGFNDAAVKTTRQEMQDIVLASITDEGKKFGVEIIDARIKGVELPTDVRTSVFERMEKERGRIAKELRAQGNASYIEITADADRTRDVMLAKAYESAEMIRGQGDAEAAGIYAKAYNKDLDFYKFNRSLEAYRKSFNQKQDLFILDPDTKFFKYFHQLQ